MGYQPSARAAGGTGYSTGIAVLHNEKSFPQDVGAKRVTTERKYANNNLVTNQGEELALRIDDSNLNHHLSNNNVLGGFIIPSTRHP